MFATFRASLALTSLCSSAPDMSIIAWSLFPTRSLRIIVFSISSTITFISIPWSLSMFPVLMHLKSFLGSICNSIIIVYNYYFDLTFGRFENQTVLAPKDIVLQRFIVPKSTLNVMFGLPTFQMIHYTDYIRTSQLLGIIIFNSNIIVLHLVLLFQKVFGSFRQYCSAMQTDSSEEEQATRRIQQAQLDSLQAQIRDNNSQKSLNR